MHEVESGKKGCRAWSLIGLLQPAGLIANILVSQRQRAVKRRRRRRRV